MKNTTLFIFASLILIVGGVFLFQNFGGTPTTGAIITGDANEGATVQPVTLSIKNGNYYPQEVRVKAEQPVAITLDKSVTGCYRSLNIRGLGVSGYSKSPSETITFTPQKPGTYRFACSMGMGYGMLIVE